MKFWIKKQLYWQLLLNLQRFGSKNHMTKVHFKNDLKVSSNVKWIDSSEIPKRFELDVDDDEPINYHFFGIFLVVTLLILLVYMMWHNRKKVNLVENSKNTSIFPKIISYPANGPCRRGKTKRRPTNQCPLQSTSDGKCDWRLKMMRFATSDNIYQLTYKYDYHLTWDYFLEICVYLPTALFCIFLCISEKWDL